MIKKINIFFTFALFIVGCTQSINEECFESTYIFEGYKIHVKGKIINNVKDGVFIHYFENGNIHMVQPYKNGKVHGIIKKTNPDSTFEISEIYQGKLNFQYVFSSSGELVYYGKTSRDGSTVSRELNEKTGCYKWIKRFNSDNSIDSVDFNEFKYSTLEKSNQDFVTINDSIRIIRCMCDDINIQTVRSYSKQ